MAFKDPVVIFIVGPTGSGKTEAALKLAGLFPCEFVSADSMQVYKGMDIMTDKLPASLRRRYRHHLIDILSPSKEYSVASFCRAAEKAVRDIIRRKKVPVVIGGTGLYVQALLDGIFEDGARDPRRRRQLERLASEKGLSFLYEKLGRVDPVAARKIDPHDAKRIIRALEVYEKTRQPISLLQKKRRGLSQKYPTLVIGLRRDRSDLYERIERRVDAMVCAGLVDEARRLLKRRLSRTAAYCIGVREMEDFLKGSASWDEAISLMKRNSRRFAKRQMTWFRKTPGIAWIDVGQGEDMACVAKKIAEKIG